MDRLWRSNSSISSRTGCPPDIVNEEDHNVDDNSSVSFRTGCPLGIVNDEDHKVESCGAIIPMCLHGTKSKILKNNILSMTDASLNDHACFNYYSNASCLYKKKDNDKSVDPNFTPIE